MYHVMASSNRAFSRHLFDERNSFRAASHIQAALNVSCSRYPAMRWLTIGVFVNIGALAVFPRLRQIGITRGLVMPVLEHVELKK